MRAWISIAVVIAFAISMSACECGPTTLVMVHLDAQPGARAAARTLHVRVFGSDGSLRLEDTRQLDVSTPWPLRLPLVPIDGDASRTWAVEATLEDASGATVAIARARGGYVAGGEREALLCLYDGCASQRCGGSLPGCVDGGSCESCRAGECVDATPPLDARGAGSRCPPGACTPRGFVEAACGDGVDDDCDGRIDCLDTDCDCDAGTCMPTRTEDTLAACHDETDDDCDGLIDCDEGGVCIFDEGPDGCGNGLDDDCDGLVDCMDPACCIAPECSGRACGAGGLVCCAGACVNTWSNVEHCGACSTACAPGRRCARVPGPGGTTAPGAACRCAVAAGECMGGQRCEELGGSSFCNCTTDFSCFGRAVCHPQAGGLHSYCEFP